MQTRQIEVPRELQELSARIDRLRARLRKSDPDMTGDEIQAAIDRAVANRSAKVLLILPRAGELYRKQIADGLSGDPHAAGKVRLVLREIVWPDQPVPRWQDVVCRIHAQG